jgi:hypothetical protein
MDAILHVDRTGIPRRYLPHDFAPWGTAYGCSETAESADPLRPMRLFGITDQTAMRYLTAAHPGRTAKLPRQPAWFSPGGWRANRSAGG